MSYTFPQKLWRSLSRNTDACFPAAWIMRTAPFCLSFPPYSSFIFGILGYSCSDYTITLFRFPVLVTHLAKSISISTSWKLAQFPYLFLCLPFISFPGPFLFFLSVPSWCAPISPVSIRRTGKELHEPIFILLPSSTSGSTSLFLSLHCQSFSALAIVPSCAFPSFPRVSHLLRVPVLTLHPTAR